MVGEETIWFVPVSRASLTVEDASAPLRKVTLGKPLRFYRFVTAAICLYGQSLSPANVLEGRSDYEIKAVRSRHGSQLLI